MDQHLVEKSDGELSVLARIMRRAGRRFMRYFTAVLSNDLVIPRHSGSFACLSFFAAVGLYGTIVGGHGSYVMHNLTSSAGLAVNEVQIVGNEHTSDIAVLQQLDLNGTTSLFALNLGAAYKNLLALPWVKDVELRKVYPNTLQINLNERHPFALWKHGEQLSLLAEDGNIISQFDGLNYANLPQYVGMGADKLAKEMDELLAKWPELKGQIKASIRVSDRRWDLRLENGITINLPETNVEDALEYFAAFDAEQNVLKRDIAEIDLRLIDRVTIRLTSDALERRKLALAERNKRLKKEQEI